ncbi:hypothetical protein B9Z65_6314 [Elsinoe australis]|uniref:Uncharacterized protein n=1 Tax=Elsinoe australis TaxID=40998 RepID=A0A2P8A8A2_9PEZI|nr:hypothetical protein B9Z65_6314 [Elsinoe australis]
MMFATAIRAVPRSVPAAVPTMRITGTQQAALLGSAVAAPAAILFAAPVWAPRAGDRADRFFEKVAEKMEKLPKFERLPKFRVMIPRIGSVGI